MPDCDTCGDPLKDPRDKNASGWWRDTCLPCMADDSGARDRTRRPPEQWLRETETPEGFDDTR